MLARGLCRCFLALSSLPAPPRPLDRTCTALMLCALHTYRRLISRWTGRQCMFEPTCSSRAVTALRAAGWTRARGAIAAQIRRCDGIYVLVRPLDAPLEMHTSDGLVFREHEIAPAIRALHRGARLQGQERAVPDGGGE